MRGELYYIKGSNRGYYHCKQIKTIYLQQKKASKYIDKFNKKTNKTKLVV